MNVIEILGVALLFSSSCFGSVYDLDPPIVTFDDVPEVVDVSKGPVRVKCSTPFFGDDRIELSVSGLPTSVSGAQYTPGYFPPNPGVARLVMRRRGNRCQFTVTKAWHRFQPTNPDLGIVVYAGMRSGKTDLMLGKSKPFRIVW